MSTYEPLYENGPIEARWPVDGPHTLDRVMDAVHAYSLAVRYLNNAVRRDHTDESLPTVPDIGLFLGRLWTGVEGMPPLVDQLRVLLLERAQDSSLTDKYHPGEPDESTETAREAAMHLEQASQALFDLHNHLAQATAATNRLVHHAPTE